MSLLEVIIALSLLFVIVGSAMTVVVNTAATTAMTEAKDRLNREAVDVMQTISLDLEQSTWLFFTRGTTAPTVTPPALDLGVTPQLTNATMADADRRYYPYVQLQDGGGTAIGGMCSDFPHTVRAANMINNATLPANLPGAATHRTTLLTPANRTVYLNSFWARSQELLFVRLNTTVWAENPALSQLPSLNFPDGDWTNTSATNRTALGVLYPNGWQAVYNAAGDITGYVERQTDPYGVLLTATEINVVNSTPVIKPSYETVDAPDNDPTVDAYPREYTYAVVPSPIGGFGRLVRAYAVRMSTVTSPQSGTEPGQFITPIPAATTYGMRVDRVLSDNCARIVFETYRTEPEIAGERNLGVYDVRIRIYMARRSSAKSELVLSRVLESVATMRGRTGETDRDNDATKVGRPVALTY